MLVEFDAETEAPVGVVVDRLENRQVRVEEDRLLIADLFGDVAVEHDETNRYRRVFEPNPWLKKQGATRA
jgi:hypothetical protein